MNRLPEFRSGKNFPILYKICQPLKVLKPFKMVVQVVFFGFLERPHAEKVTDVRNLT